MALDVNYLSQLETFTSGMKTYYKNLSLNLTTSSSAVPMFEDVIGTFDYSEILRHALDGQKASANFMTGAMVDTIHDIMAVQREFSIRSKTRAAYFTDAVSDAELDYNYYDAYYVNNLNLFKGTSPDQS